MNEYLAAVCVLLIAAGWDVARRHFSDRAAKRELPDDHDQRIKVLEANQRELLARLNNATQLSRFQRRG